MEVELDDFFSQEVYWCQVCGCVQTAILNDGGLHSRGNVRVSEVAKKYWDEKES